MKIAVSYDEAGNILTLFDPEAMRTEAGFFTYTPSPGESHRVFDIPSEFDAARLLDLPRLLRVDTTGPQPRLECKSAPSVSPVPPAVPSEPQVRPEPLGEAAV
ncbi:MAG TPA: hypothetical protein VMM16_09000 [Verrucomicrobiae bacterium]|nr:hypothetical protein [Verrucomicrobiae bacterium]